jgi:hypothetical protein
MPLVLAAYLILGAVLGASHYDGIIKDDTWCKTVKFETGQWPKDRDHECQKIKTYSVEPVSLGVDRHQLCGGLGCRDMDE